MRRSKDHRAGPLRARPNLLGLRAIRQSAARVAACLPVDLAMEQRGVAPAEGRLEQRRGRVQHVGDEHEREALEPLRRRGRRGHKATLRAGVLAR